MPWPLTKGGGCLVLDGTVLSLLGPLSLYSQSPGSDQHQATGVCEPALAGRRGAGAGGHLRIHPMYEARSPPRLAMAIFITDFVCF